MFDRLVERGATVVVVDLGPGTGQHGGRVLSEGPPALLARANTPTGRHLRALA